MDDHDEMIRGRVRELNDRLRRTGTGGRIMLTRAVGALPEKLVASIIMAIRAFDSFSNANDPWGEHDFGQVEVEGAFFFWKIDAYDFNWEFASPDPSNVNVTRRVLTIMAAQDI